MVHLRAVLVSCLFLVGLASGPAPVDAEEPSPTLVETAQAWLATLPPAQRRRASLSFDSSERRNWHYVPRQRFGIGFHGMSAPARRAGLALAARALGPEAWAKAEAVFRLEGVLQAQARRANPRVDPSWRDPLRYFLTVFGRPDAGRTWGVRLEGHHLSANLTCRGSTVVACVPFFLGASPASLRTAGGVLLRPFGREEDLAREVIASLPAELRTRAAPAQRIPGDVLYGPARGARRTGQGLDAAAMSAETRARLRALVERLLEVAPPDVRRRERAALDRTGLQGVRILWLGALDPGADHYYRIEAPAYVFELRNLGNHTHLVWRDPRGEFGDAPRVR